MKEERSTAKNYAWTPNSYLVKPWQFGYYEDVEWIDVPADNHTEQDRLLAAKWQHTMVLLAHDAMQFRHMTIRDVAKQTRMGSAAFGRLMRGVGPMKVEDFAALSRILKVSFARIEGEAPTPAIRRPDGRRPSGP